MMRGVEIRPRRPEDIDELAAILDRAGVVDGYPPHRPAPSRFLIATRDELAAFVVVDPQDRPVGHVALHEASAPSVMQVAAAATGLPMAKLASVARLFVDPTAQRRGLGRALLDHASADARHLGRRPVLDVWEELPSARALYESARWTAVGATVIEFRSGCTPSCVHEGTSIRSFVYVSPASAALRDDGEAAPHVVGDPPFGRGPAPRPPEDRLLG